MAKLTVQALAEKLNKSAKEVIRVCEELNIFVPNESSTLTKEEAAGVIEKITGKKPRITRRPKEGANGEEAGKAASESRIKEQEAAGTAPAAPSKTEAIDQPASVDPSAQNKENSAATDKEDKQAAQEKTGDLKPLGVKEQREVPHPRVRPRKEAPDKTVKTEKTVSAAKPQPAKAKNAQPAKPAAKAAAKTGTETAADKASQEVAGPKIVPNDVKIVNAIRPASSRNTPQVRPQVRPAVRPSVRRQEPKDGQGTDRSSARQGTGVKSQGRRPAQGQARPGMSRDGARKPQSPDGRFQSKDKDAAGVRRPSSRPAAKRPAGGRGGDSYDMGISQPDRRGPEKPVKKSDKRYQERQRNSESEQYKNKKNQLIQEANYLDDDRLSRHKKRPVKHVAENAVPQEEDDIKIVALPESMTVKELADMLHKPLPVIIKALMGKGIMAGLNQVIEYDQAEELASEMDILVEHQVEEDIFKKYAEYQDAPEDLVPRSPVVVVMGHVDHGKTSILDAIRHTNVTSREAGGITQHIGASVVNVGGRRITFLDTPGHEAFTAMRMRGAMVTDIAILVVAADDGVMPQTIEAINHAKAAKVQIVVAINKMDKPGANPERVKEELTKYDLVPEDWGGNTICVPCSAVKHEGIDDLLENVLLVADMLELKANPDAPASGAVIESQLDKGRGAVATILVQRGTLQVGDPIVAGKTFGRVKTMTDDKGKRIKKAGPSTPVEITGLSEVPTAGDMFYETESDHEARLLAEKVSARERAKMIEGNKKVNLNDLFSDIQSGNVKELNILVKADVQGSVEAVKQSLEKLSNDEVKVNVIHGAVGGINESDIMLASAANAIIIGFNVRPDAAAKSVAEEQKVDIRLYRIIYDAINDITAAMKGMLAPTFEEKINGHAQVRQIFHASGLGTIAGSYVTDGKIVRGSQVRLLRDNIVVFEGPMASLRRFKDDVKEVATGYECGIMLEKFNDGKEGDVIESYSMEEIKRD